MNKCVPIKVTWRPENDISIGPGGYRIELLQKGPKIPRSKLNCICRLDDTEPSGNVIASWIFMGTVSFNRNGSDGK